MTSSVVRITKVKFRTAEEIVFNLQHFHSGVNVDSIAMKEWIDEWAGKEIEIVAEPCSASTLNGNCDLPVFKVAMERRSFVCGHICEID